MDELEVDKKYLDYIENIITNIQHLVPDDVNDLQKNYLITNIKKSANLMATSMTENNEFSELDFDDQCFYLQLIIEWSFHKEIDLFRSGIPAKYWKVVMQKIWYTMWEVMFACVKNEAPPEVVLNLTERFVNRSYADAVEELKLDNIIDETTEEKAKEQSNITIMAEKIKIEKILNNKIKYITKMILIFIILATIVVILILKFQTAGTITVFVCMILYLLFSHKIS